MTICERKTSILYADEVDWYKYSIAFAQFLAVSHYPSLCMSNTSNCSNNIGYFCQLTTSWYGTVSEFSKVQIAKKFHQMCAINIPNFIIWISNIPQYCLFCNRKVNKWTVVLPIRSIILSFVLSHVHFQLLHPKLAQLSHSNIFVLIYVLCIPIPPCINNSENAKKIKIKINRMEWIEECDETVNITSFDVGLSEIN